MASDWRNMCRCKICGDVIESKSVHDYVTCKCGACFTDGGREYVRRGWVPIGPNGEHRTLDDVIEDIRCKVGDEYIC